MTDSRIQQVVNEIEEAKKVAAHLNAILDDARTIVSDMVDNTSGLKPHSAWYLNHVRGGLNTFIADVNRGALGITSDIEWLQKLPEAQAS